MTLFFFPIGEKNDPDLFPRSSWTPTASLIYMPHSNFGNLRLSQLFPQTICFNIRNLKPGKRKVRTASTLRMDELGLKHTNKFHNTVDSWATQVGTAHVHLYSDFSVNTCTVPIQDWESKDAEDQLHCLAILYSGLEHPWILVLMGAPGNNPPPILRNDLSFRGVKSCI